MTNFKHFKHLHVPDHWQQYWSKYPQGYTIMEALISWVSQVDHLTDNVNDWNDYLNTFVETFDTKLQDNVRELVQELYDSGKLAELTAQVIDVVQDQIDEANSSIENINNIIDSEPYNITRDVDIDQEIDITDYLIDLMETNRNIYIPEGRYIISQEILMPNNVTINGDVGKTVLVFIDEGCLHLGHNNVVEDLAVEAPENYEGRVFYVTNRFVVGNFDNQRCNIRVRNIRANKPFNPNIMSTFFECAGLPTTETVIGGGFYGLIAEDITVRGFNQPLYLRVVNGWVHANKFINWTVHQFTHAVHMHGSRTSSEERDDRIRRNIFENWVIQPTGTQSTQSEIIKQNKDFTNEWVGIDPWDLDRWHNNMAPWGKVTIDGFLSDRQNVNNFRHGYNYSPGYYYPILSRINMDGAMIAQLDYTNGVNRAVFSFSNNSLTCQHTDGYNKRLKFYVDDNGVYYMATTEYSAGAIYYSGLRNAGTYPYYLYNEDNPNLPDLQEVPITYELLSVSTSETTSTLLGGHTGSLTITVSGHLVNVTGIINGANKTSNSVKTVPIPMTSPISFRDQEGGLVFNVTGGGYLFSYGDGEAIDVNVTYPRAIE